jgi:hypothetical protein
LARVHGEWLRELEPLFRIVWGTAWGEEANRHIGPVLGLPPWPWVALPPIPFAPEMKVPAIDALVAGAPCAWVEDRMTQSAKDWANARTEATLLIDVDPAVGLTRSMVDQLVAWVAALADSHHGAK